MVRSGTRRAVYLQRADMELTSYSTCGSVGHMSEDRTSNFGATLRELRRQAGLTQRGLAARTALDFSYISKIENGRLPPPSADTLVAICGVLDVPAEDLLALVGKIPSDVQRTVSTSREAQRFLLEAGRMSPTDREWGQLAASLRQLRDER